MKYGSSAFSTLLVDGFNLLAAKVKGVTHRTESITEPTHGLGDASEENTPVGMTKVTLTQDGAFFTTGANGMHDALKGGSQQPRVVCFSVGAGFVGCLGAFSVAYEVIAQNGLLTKANAAYVVSGDVDAEGVILESGTHTIDWDGAAVDSGASSPNGGVGYLQVSQMTGLTGFIGKIQDSPDGVTWTDLITFANVAAAPAAQRVAVSGVVDRYLRFKGDVTGVGSITVFSGFSRTA